MNSKPKPKPKPILKSERIPKKIKKQNHYKPGFVYLFHDPLVVVTKGVTLCKAGLSGKPKRRRYFLSQEYQNNLIIKAMAFRPASYAPTMNRRVTEVILHKMFEKHNVLRQQGLDGYTEWFAVDLLRIVQMQVSLYLVAILVNLLYLVVIAVMIMTIVQLILS